ncbi:PTS sugar transporter subunit IIA [Pectinatus frisingensis]|uniref:PTS sugar transporter subunit IIA n=1 Tax=Pectinatus frisingensis TaxID=865 RepID=UPI0018C72489|nr:PTS sugar transporter subunit IIA [Pectinatus frisingensis]
MINNYIYPELIWINKAFLNRDDLFKSFSSWLVQNGYVEKNYYQSLTKRENAFPTGLDIGGYSVAIPHSECKNIKKEFVGIVILASPISMNKMDNSYIKIPVDCFFFLGIKNGQDHIEVLQKIIKIIKNKNTIKALKSSNDTDTIVNILKNN